MRNLPDLKKIKILWERCQKGNRSCQQSCVIIWKDMTPLSEEYLLVFTPIIVSEFMTEDHKSSCSQSNKVRAASSLEAAQLYHS